MKKRFLTTLLAVAITLMVTACGNPVTDQEATANKEIVTEDGVDSSKVADETASTSVPTDEGESVSELTSADESKSVSEQSPADEPEFGSEQSLVGGTESVAELTPTDDSVPSQEITEIPTVTEKPAEVTAPAKNRGSASESKTDEPGFEEVDAKIAAARAKIAEAEANMDFFSCTPQDYVDAGYLSEETARALMQGMGQPVQEAPAQEALVPEGPAPAVSADIFGKVNNMTDAQYAAVLPILQDMAITALATGTTDLDHVRAAAQMVYVYAANAVYATEGNYNKPYGLIFEGVYTCAATCRTTAMVLILMGYPDVVAHNLSQWNHQWVTLTVDGQVGWADGIAGIADYGTYPLYGDDAPGYYEDPVTGLIWY